jgi:Protein of unknown function (DUF2844)
MSDRRKLAWIAAVLAFAAAPAWAGLGESVDSIARDHVALRGASLQVTPKAAFDLHEITTPGGSRVREYASKSGTVFAVAFRGRMPDLHVLLASHYAEYQAATEARRGNHRALSISTPGLSLNIMKLPRGFTGSAQVPSLMPAGTSAKDLEAP